MFDSGHEHQLAEAFQVFRQIRALKLIKLKYITFSILN